MAPLPASDPPSPPTSRSDDFILSGGGSGSAKEEGRSSRGGAAAAPGGKGENLANVRGGNSSGDADRSSSFTAATAAASTSGREDGGSRQSVCTIAAAATGVTNVATATTITPRPPRGSATSGSSTTSAAGSHTIVPAPSTREDGSSRGSAKRSNSSNPINTAAPSSGTSAATAKTATAKRRRKSSSGGNGNSSGGITRSSSSSSSSSSSRDSNDRLQGMEVDEEVDGDVSMGVVSTNVVGVLWSDVKFVSDTAGVDCFIAGLALKSNSNDVNAAALSLTGDGGASIVNPSNWWRQEEDTRSTQMRGGKAPNLGNTCYMNSSLQALLSTAPVRALLSKINLEASFQQNLPPISNGGDDVETTSRPELVLAIRDILDVSFRGQTSGRRRRGGAGVTIPRNLLHQVKQYLDNWPQFRGWRQHDPQEALNLIVEGMDKALSYHPVITNCASALVSAMDAANEHVREFALRYDYESSQMEGSPIRDLFEIKQITQTSCSNCGRVSGTGSTLLMLNLEIPSNARSIGECLANAFEPEPLEEYKCDGCGVRDCCSRTQPICRYPPILTLQLKRFAFGASSEKITRLIEFPLTGLDISQYVMSGMGGQDAVYDVYAVMNQTGTIGSGHCFTYAMGRDGQWNVHDDMKEIKSIPLSEVVTNNAYVLLARRRDVPSGKVASLVEEEDEVKAIDESPDAEVPRRTTKAEGSSGRSIKSSGRRMSSGSASSKKSTGAPKANGDGSKAGNSGSSGKKSYHKNRKLSSKGNPLRNDNGGSCGGDNVSNVNEDDTAAAKAVPVLTKVEDQRKAMSDNLAVCMGIEQRTAKLIDNATKDVDYRQCPKDVGRGQAQNRGSASFTPHGDNLGGTRSTDHSAKAKKSIEVFLNAVKQFLIRNGMDPRDEGLVEGYSILFQRGGGMGWHPDTAKKDFQRYHWLRLVFSRGGSGALDFASHSFETGDGQATKIDPNHPLPISVATTEGYHLYGMSARMSGMSALCWTNEEKSRAIQQYHRVNQTPLDGNQRVNIVITVPFRRWEDVEKVLAAINGKLFSLFPAGSQREATARAKRAAVDAVNSKDVIRCESDETHDCQHCDNGQAVTAIRPENGGGDRFSCPPTHCGKCASEQVKSGDFELDAFIPADRFPMGCQCGRDKMGNKTCCSIHFGENKPCLGCNKLGCYAYASNWCKDCIKKDRPGKDKRCWECNEMGCYKTALRCRRCLGIGICSKCGGDTAAGSHKYCDTCEPLCKEEKCTHLRRSHLSHHSANQYCALHSKLNRARKSGPKPCAKCGKDKGGERKWCSTCRDTCKNCPAVLTTDRKNKTGENQHYCSNKCLIAMKKKST